FSSSHACSTLAARVELPPHASSSRSSPFPTETDTRHSRALPWAWPEPLRDAARNAPAPRCGPRAPAPAGRQRATNKKRAGGEPVEFVFGTPPLLAKEEPVESHRWTELGSEAS